ncbi:MAG: cation-translocating P-type ATPase [Actinobacteria bacterium]|nr:cation-translocating P-type ATPase [Actinomycetota bacterium]
MTCASCVARVERKLSKIPGVQASVDLATESAHVVAPASVPLEQLLDAVKAAGYEASLRTLSADADLDAELRARDLRRRLVLATVLGIPVVLVSMVMPWHFNGWQWWAAGFSAPIAWWSALPFHSVALRQLRHGSSSMDTLVSLGVAAAWLGSAYALLRASAAGTHAVHTAHVWFEVVAAVTVFLLLGRLLEQRATRESGAAVRELLALQSVRARRERADGTVEDVPSDLVLVGDILIINPGELVPVDGVIIEGATAVDESMLTGESVPVDAAVGDVLTGGTVVASGRVRMRATAVGAATRIAQISERVLRAQSRKSQTQRLADRISSIFVPIVMTLAAVTATLWVAIGHSDTAVTAAIAVLVVACPCALGLATPTAMLAGVGRGAQAGILISGPEVLERAAAVDTIMFDKTGTLTYGQLRVVQTLGVDTLSIAQWRALTATAAASNHPVSRAVAAFAASQGHTPGVASDVVEHPGAGVAATVDGAHTRLGKPEWATATSDVAGTAGERSSGTFGAGGLDLDAWQNTGFSVVVFTLNGQAKAAFAIADEHRDDAAEVVRSAAAQGLTPWLVTGDHAGVAARVATHAGIAAERVRSDISPEGKQELVASLQSQGHRVVMVGDGINDAAALAAADIGIAMGAGTGAAIAAGDITVVGSNLSRAMPALRLARATLRTIKVNLFWAFAYNFVMIPLAAFGILDPMVAGFAMAASSVLVVTNSLRLRRVALD